MPKQKKHKSGETYKWVAKDAAEEEKQQRKRVKEEGPSLEEFASSDWPPTLDESSTSNKDYYFNSYAHFGIHEDMLKDQVRTGSYMKAILGSRHLFEGKTVLDVGSGTGILCLFAAKAGAKRCIGIECSDIKEHAAAIAEQNGYGEVITYVKGKVEEVELPVDEVDIIISEWMGYFLIYESMLDSVLFARDKWLRKDGLLFPDHARLYIGGIEDADYKEEKIGFWSHVWGFDFSPMQQMVIQEPISDFVDVSAIATSTCCVLELDLRTCRVRSSRCPRMSSRWSPRRPRNLLRSRGLGGKRQVRGQHRWERREDLDFLAPYSLTLQRKDFVHALVVWFDVSFRAHSPPVVLSTAPGQPATHWKQTVLYLDDPLVGHKGDKISGILAVRKSLANPRDLDVKVSVDFRGKVGQASKVHCYRVR